MLEWRRNLYVLWTAQFILLIGISFVMPFIPLYIQELGVKDFASTARWSGLIFGVPFLFSALCAPIWGTIGDLYGRKPLILLTMLADSVILTLMSSVKNVYQLFVLRILLGILGGSVGPVMALVSTSVPREKLGSSLGFLQTSMMAGGIVGPFIGGVLADMMGYRPLFKITGALALTSATLVAFFVKEKRGGGEEKKTSYGLRANLSFFFHSKELLAIALSIFIMQYGVMLVEPVLPLFISSLGVKKEVLSTVTGAIFASTGVVNIFATPLWGRRADRKGYKSTLVICILCASICYIPQAFVKNAIQLAFLRVVLGIFSSGIFPATQAIISANVPEERRGGILGMTNSVGLLAGLVGPTTGGILAGIIGIRLSFIFTFALVFLSWLFVRAVVKEPPFIDTEESSPIARKTSEI